MNKTSEKVTRGHKRIPPSLRSTLSVKRIIPSHCCVLEEYLRRLIPHHLDASYEKLGSDRVSHGSIVLNDIPSSVR